MEENRVTLNEMLPAYSQISKMKIYPEEFEKTPKKSIKRFLYQEAKDKSSLYFLKNIDYADLHRF